MLAIDALDFIGLSMIFVVVLIGFALTDWGLERPVTTVNISVTRRDYRPRFLLRT
jgi:hypothetical protein